MDPESGNRWPEAEDGVFGELTGNALRRFFASDFTKDPFEDAKSRSHFWVDQHGNVHQNYEDRALADYLATHQGPEPIPDDVLKSIDDAFHWDGK